MLLFFDRNPLVQFGAVASIHFLVSLLGLAYIVVPEQLTVFWPAGGLLLGYLLRIERTRWNVPLFATFIGNGLANAVHGHSLLVSLGFAVLNVVEPLFIALFIRHYNETPFDLKRTRSVIFLFVGPSLVCGFIALWGAALVSYTMGAPYWTVWKTWWLADALGAILFAPVTLTAFLPGRKSSTLARKLEVTLLCFTIFAFEWYTFIDEMGTYYPILAMTYPVLPLLLWLSSRADLSITAIAIVIVSIMATNGTIQGSGPVGRLNASQADRVLITQGFVATVCLSSFVLATMLHERQLIEIELRDKKQTLRAILNSMGDAVLVANNAGKVVLSNPAFEQLLPGAISSVTPTLVGPSGFTIYHADGETPFPIQNLSHIAKSQNESFDNLHLILMNSSNTDRIHLSVSGRPLMTTTGAIGGVVSIRDITESVKVEAELATNNALLQLFIKHAPAAIAMFDRNMCYLRTSDRWITDYRLTGKEIIGKSHYDVIPGIPKRWKEVHRKALAGKIFINDDDTYCHEDGTVEHLTWECRPWYRRPGVVGGIIMFAQIVTERKRAEVALRVSEERYRSVVESLTEGVVLQNASGEIVAANNRACEILGFTRDMLIGRQSVDSCWGAVHEDGTEFPGIEHPAMVALNTHHVVSDVVMGIRRPNQEQVWLRVNAVPIRQELFHGIEGAVVASFRDITEERKLNQQIKASLREKEVLLREIHHRVKNNLQIVITLLDLQADEVKDAHARKLFEESRSRVRSMSLIHERLYRSKDLASVNFGQYLRQLADDLYRTYKVSHDDIQLVMDVRIPPLPVDVAVPCGLLLNELMSNCFKHAFSDCKQGTIKVALFQMHGGINVLRVSDDGKGFPADIDCRNTTSFGLQLVNTLAEQLGGRLELESGKGCRFTIHFPTQHHETSSVVY